MSKKITVTREFNEAYQRTLSWFFDFPTIETGLNDLASDTRISKTTAKRVVNKLVKEGFLIKKVYGKSWRISVNKNHTYNHTEKIAANLTAVYEAYRKGLRDIIFEHVKSPQAIVLFGSYRKGDDTEKSDIDIAVEVMGDQQLEIIKDVAYITFGYRKNVPVNLHVFSRKAADLNLFANIANGIVLEGFLEVRP